VIWVLLLRVLEPVVGETVRDGGPVPVLMLRLPKAILCVVSIRRVLLNVFEFVLMSCWGAGDAVERRQRC
jgi:hypothetical protein